MHKYKAIHSRYGMIGSRDFKHPLAAKSWLIKMHLNGISKAICIEKDGKRIWEYEDN